MVVFATKQSRFLTVGSIPLADMKRGWDQAKRSLTFAVNFLRENAGIIDESLLTSPMIYLTVAYYSYLKNEHLTQDEIKALKYWVYIASARGRYSGSSETKLDTDLRAMEQPDGLQQLLGNLRQQFGRFEFDEADFERKGINSGLFYLMFLVMKEKGAVDWSTGLQISTRLQGNQHKLEFHHIIPKSRLKSAYERFEINDIANLAFISGRTNQRIGNRNPEEYLAKIRAEKGDEVLLNQCVPLDPALHRVEAFREFLHARRKLLVAAVNEFVGRCRPAGIGG
jgi:hypothetical protein